MYTKLKTFKFLSSQFVIVWSFNLQCAISAYQYYRCEFEFNTAWNWSLYRSGHAHLARTTKMADEITDTVYFSNWCMVTESIMKWVFWYLSYIMSSYKHWNVECVGDNHPLKVLNKIGCIFTLVYGYWKYHVSETTTPSYCSIDRIWTKLLILYTTK
jgi:hypothetical protein